MIPTVKRATRKDVARHAGVSDAVVSYTLNGGAPVAPATAARVREAVRLLGYRPNAAALALKNGSAKLIGVIVPDATNPFWVELCQSIEAVVASDGYKVIVASSHEGPALDVAQSLAARQVDGLLIAPTTPLQQGDVDAFDALGVRWTVINNSLPLEGAVGIGTDLVHGADIATTHLIEHGCRRIAFVGRQREPRNTGWHDAVRRAGLAPGLVIETEFTRIDGYRAGQLLAAARDGIDGAFISSDLIASGALLALHEAGVRVPQDMALVAFDGTDEARYTWPPLTTVAQPIQQIAADAVRSLFDHHGADFDRPHGVLRLGWSCGCTEPLGVPHTLGA